MPPSHNGGVALVTGASGFIGGNLVGLLLERGYRVVAITRQTGQAAPAGLTWAAADVSQPETVRAVWRDHGPFTHVFNLAAAGVREDRDTPAEAMSVNAIAPVNLAIASLGASAESGGLRAFVHMGTGSEYLPAAVPLDERAPLGGMNFYGAAKASAWMMLERLRVERGLPLVTMRPFSVYGPGEKPPRFFPALLEKALARERFEMTAGLQTRDYVHVADLAEAAVLAAERGACGVYNIGAGPAAAMTIRDIARLAYRLAGADPALLSFGVVSRRRPEPPYFVADATRAATELGWRPRWTLEEGLAAMIAQSRASASRVGGAA